MSDEEIELLKGMLFKKQSRNKNFDQFELPQNQRLRQTAKIIERLRKDLHHPQTHHWYDQLEDGRIRVRWHRPHLSVSRTVFLPPAAWELVWDDAWEQAITKA
ncbi:MAG: hypothetical protein H6728_11660 [Myxococcales bacterium]|nr:hypothetical protein [Myxococcales bacterium]